MYLIFFILAGLFGLASFIFFVFFLVYACCNKKFSTFLKLFLSFLGVTILLFVLFIFSSPNDNSNVKTEVVLNNVTKIEEDEPKIPTISPTPIPQKVYVLEVDDVMLSEDMIGTPQLSVSMTNTGDSDVDAFDIKVRCYNKYDELIRGYGFDDYYNGTSQDTIIKAGETKDIDGCWSLYGFDNATRFEVSIDRYHTVDGDTVEINNADLIWYSVSK